MTQIVIEGDDNTAEVGLSLVHNGDYFLWKNDLYLKLKLNRGGDLFECVRTFDSELVSLHPSDSVFNIKKVSITFEL